MKVCARGSAGAISDANTASDDPDGHDHEADHGERLTQARMDAAGPRQRAAAEDAGGHVTRIRGSMIPYRMSTMKFTVT